MAELLAIRRKTISNQLINQILKFVITPFSNSLKRILKLVITNSNKFVITDSKIRFNKFLNSL